ncbi:aspartoacylase [Anabaena sp. FACHB-1237]|uniref:aspartoacylase n=1 Tax=Anabaena sp. FACHB-1237 TaxID=2692769 RepID=UPI001680DD6C|nr:aspartoacylase [Anabaena sp. FACHB-1237]MBD2138034.1 aspartoacylase [Anabaena sp. FACHB-1237]
MMSINKVAIVGGSHGNELTGIFLVKKFQQYPSLIHRSSFQTLPLLGNIKAIEQCTRYIEKDLNRCFHNSDLPRGENPTYEDVRAKEIQAVLTPKNQPGVDAIIDLHSTTANMGLSVIFGSYHLFLLKLGAYLTEINPLVKICIHQQKQYSGFLRSLCELGIVIEVGAVAQGVLDAKLFQDTEQVIYGILDYLEATNHNQLPPINKTITLYKSVSTIDYPRSENGEIKAIIHPQLQFKDYQPLHPGDPLFVTFTGEEIYYEGENIVYPIFINEAAYYEKGIAMHLTEKIILDLV